MSLLLFFPRKLITVLKHSLEVCQLSQHWDYKCCCCLLQPERLQQMVSNSQTLTGARLQLKGETFRSSQPWCGAAKDSSSQIAESHCGVRTHQDSVLRARGSTTSSECCMMSEMTGFLSCI